jgi:hypothetical protein
MKKLLLTGIATLAKLYLPDGALVADVTWAQRRVLATLQRRPALYIDRL